MLGIVDLTQMAKSFPGLNFLAWSVGWQEILIVVIVVLILFGGRKIPELARGIGRGMREFKREMRGVKEDFDEALKEEEEEEARPRRKKKRKRPVEKDAESEEASEAEEAEEAK